MQSRQQEDEPKKVEEKTGGAFGWFNKKADHVSKQADNKAPDAKNKAAELTDNVVASVKGAAENTKSGLNDAAHNVSSGTKDARNKIGDVSAPCLPWPDSAMHGASLDVTGEVSIAG